MLPPVPYPRNPAGRLRKMLLIQPGETGKVVYFLLFFMLVSAGMAIGNGTANALFLKRIGIEYLPLMYMAQSLFLAVVSLGYAAIADRLPAERFFRLSFAVLLLVVFVCWLLIRQSDDGLVYPAYYLFHEVAAEVLLVHAALYLNQNMNTLQVKRLAPLMYAGAQAGNITGGLLLAFIAPLTGTGNLLLVWCLLLATAGVLLYAWHRKHGTSSHFRASRISRNPLVESVSQVRQGIHYTLGSGLLRSASLALFFMVISFYVMCYSINRIYNETFTIEAELTGFFGTLTAVTSSIALLLQLFLTSRVIQRFGIRRINMLFPVTSTLVLAALSFSFTLPVALLGSLNKDAIMPAFRNPVRTMFFSILPTYMQGRARALSVAIVLPAALFVCGLLLWFMQRTDNPVIFIAPGIAAACLFAWYSLRMNRAYVSTLIGTLRERLFLPRDRMYRELGDGDGEAMEEISRGVRHADADVAVSFARVLVASFPDQAAGIILQRAAGADAVTTDRLLGLLKDLELAGYSARLRAMAADGDDHLQATVISLLARGNVPGLHDEVLRLVQSTNPRLSATAIQVALRLAADGPVDDDVPAAWWRLLRGNTHDNLASLALIPDLPIAPAADRAGLESAYRALFPRLLRETSVSVRSRALDGMQGWAYPLEPDVVALFVEYLDSDNPQLRFAVTQCLHLAGGDRGTALLQQALGDGHARVRQAALGCLEKTGADFSVIVPEWIGGNRISLRAQQVLLAAEQTAILPENIFTDIAMSKAREAEQLQHASQRLRIHAGDATSVPRRLLGYVLHERFEQTVQLALQALEPLYEPGLIEVIRAGFSSGDERHIANAGEALSNLTNQPATGLLYRLLVHGREAQTDTDTGVFHTVRDVLNWCAGLQEEWVQSCAGRALQEDDLDEVYA